MIKKINIGSIDLESGGVLHDVEIACSILGPELGENRKVIWVCHALTSGSDPRDWWPDIIGQGLSIDTEKHTIICCNIIGSCYGSTGPLSINPATRRAYGIDFPKITYKDIVKTFEKTRIKLGIKKIDLLLGGSIGGQQALEWALTSPELFSSVVLLATNAVHSPWGIAFNESQRMAIRADQEYYNGGKAALGLAAARAIGLLSYRNYECYNKTQGTQSLGSKKPNNQSLNPAISYQNYQGQKLNKRFDVHSYVTLLNLMDSHDIGRGRGNIDEILSKLLIPVTVIGISSDILFPTEEQKRLVHSIPDSRYIEIDSLYGHDGFLLESNKISRIIKENI